MPMIQPFTYQHCTAFKERKQLADKVNEIVDVINDTDMETVNSRIDQVDSNIDNLDLRVDKLENIKLIEMNESQYASYIEKIVDSYGEISYGFKNDVLLVDHVNTCKIYIKAHTPFNLCESIINRMNYYSDGMDIHNYRYTFNNLTNSNKTVSFTDSHLYIKPANITGSVWNNTTINKTLWTDLSVYVYKEV